MNELSIEQKAKRYDEAIEKARNIVKSINVGLIGKDSFEAVFPELAESEDEKMRKWIINYLDNRILNSPISEEKKACTDAITWLKKQGEQKHVVIIPNFKVGDWIVFNGLTLYVKEVVKGFYRTIARNGVTNSYDWDIDNVTRLWTIQDAKDGDVLAGHETIVLFKKIEGQNIRCYCTYLFTDNPHFYVNTIQSKNPYCPATKEQRDLLFAKMKEAGYVWDAEKKELKEIKQKSTDNANKVELRFKVGVWVVYDGWVCQIIDVTEDGYCNSKHGFIPKDREDSMRLWTIADAKDGDVLVASDKSLFIYDGSINENASAGFHIAFTEDMDIILNSDDGCVWEEKDSCHPATKEQCDLLFQKIKDAGYEWDAEKKELKKIENPTAWSEEDERMYIELHNLIYSTPYYSSRKELSDWLKSLKDKVQLQPKQEWSEEDKKMLENIKKTLYNLTLVEADGQAAFKKELAWLKSLIPR